MYKYLIFSIFIFHIVLKYILYTKLFSIFPLEKVKKNPEFCSPFHNDEYS